MTMGELPLQNQYSIRTAKLKSVRLVSI